MIVETSDNRFYRVTESAIAHLWSGIAVKKVGGEFVEKKNARPELIRKIGTKLVACSS